MSTDSEQATVPRTPPTGIKIVCWFGVFTVVVGFIAMLLAFAEQLVNVGLVALLIMGIEIAVVYGLWMLQPWGLLSALAWYGIGLIIASYRFVSGDISSLIGVIIGVFLLGLVYGNRDVYS